MEHVNTPACRQAGSKKQQEGAILIFALVFMLVVVILVGSLVSYASLQIRSHRQAMSRVAGLSIAEAAVELALWRLNNESGYSGETGTVYGNGEYDITITDITTTSKLITADVYVPNSSSPIAKRRLQITTNINTDNVSFNYGAQVGEGGLDMDNNSQINGNVYSNGDITGGNNAVITGTAVAANGPALTADQTNDTPLPPTSNITFRNAAASADVAQSFQLGTTGTINKVELYLRKVGNPSNFTAIRITNDNAGNPGSTTIASGSLNASTITTTYGWVTSTFSSNPSLTAGTTYWLVLDAASTSAANYFQWGANTAYASGLAKTGVFSGGPWNATATDGYFKIFLGGLTRTIDNIDVGTAGVGDARAHTVTGSTIQGNNYCQVGSGNNKVCNTSQPDPVSLALPISDGNIRDWESDAEVGGTIGSQTITGVQSLGPVKINGDLSINNGASLTLNGTVWVTGNVIVDTNGTLKISTGYGALSGLLIAGVEDSPTTGNIHLENGSIIAGSGTAGSYIMLLSQMNHPTNTAIHIANNSSTAIIYAGDGVLELANNAGAKEITAYKIHLNNEAEVTYESGLANAQFTSGPGASWQIQEQSWQLLQ